MRSWFETTPAAALAWAQSPRNSFGEYKWAAHVIGLSAAGDPQKLAAALLALPAGATLRKYCLDDYFDLIGTTTGNPDPAPIYENIPAPLREAAWPITMDRLIAVDTRAAADWLTVHVNDPGAAYILTSTLIDKLVEKDPSGTAQWAASFPNDPKSNRFQHPAFVATLRWLEKDPAAAKAWLQNQPSTAPWVSDVLRALEEKETPKEPEADKTEN